MKKFWKVVLAVVCGLLIFNLLTLFLFLNIGASLGTPVRNVPAAGILKVDMSGITVSEQSTEPDILASLSSQYERVPVGILDATMALRKAAADPGVKAIYLKADAVSAGIAGATEFRKALEEFRASGKPVVSYVENPTTVSMYLASVADKVYMTSCQGGSPMFTGISTQLMFYKDLLDEIGVNVQLIRHGKYKSAGEPYIRNSASKENLEQNRAMVSSLWKSYGGPIADSRGLTISQLDACIDGLKLCVPEDFVDCGLVDELVSRSQLESKLASLYGVSDYDHVQMIPFADYVTASYCGNVRARKKIAVIYADGEIVDGLDYENVDGDRFASIIEDIRKDETVKAVVLRVNSPGGSVVASDRIRAELDLLSERVPVVASYSDYAASGGYWISNGCTKIFSDESTLTGSIGVFGIVPDLSGLLKDHAKLGIESVGSHKHSDLMTLTRPLDKEEHAWMQRSIEGIYDRFVNLVAQSRGMTPAQVDDIAQGRVWTGADALGIGLVDEIGTLADALQWTAAYAGDQDLQNGWQIASYPRPMTAMEQLAASLDPSSQKDYSIRAAQRWYESWQNGSRPYAFARMPFDVRFR